MTIHQSRDTVSRRTALAGLSAGGLGVALAATVHQASAQPPAADLSKHPIVGSWYATTPGGPAIAAFHPDGTVVMGLPATQAGPNPRCGRAKATRVSATTIMLWSTAGKPGSS